MAKFFVTGGKKLEGSIKVSGNKNSALKLIPATLLASSPCTLTNVPNISDVNVMLDLVRALGAKVDHKDHVVTIDPSGLNSYDLDPTLSGKFRASVVLAAPLLVKFGKAIVTPPGGDQIGERLLDTHFNLMKKMGVTIERRDNRYLLEWKKRENPTLFLEEASVTATEMALMLATCSDQKTVIENAATEPHVTDLARMLTKMGAKIDGIGFSTLTISGGKLSGVEYNIMPDHIEAGTFAIASAITGGHVLIKDFILEHNKMALVNFENMGVKFKHENNTLEVFPSELVASRKKFKAQPWPGFPTDLMSPFIVLATQTKGTTLCHDWMYEWRMFFVDDLISMGANIFIADPHRVIISGPTPLSSDRLFCKDIRAGVSVILAALAANGRSEIENIEVVDRGYEDIENRFASLGAEIKRVNPDEKP